MCAKRPEKQEVSSDRAASLPFVLQMDQPVRQPTPHELRAGDICPTCKVERMDYDGLLNLACPRCGTAQGGCFT